MLNISEHDEQPIEQLNTAEDFAKLGIEICRLTEEINLKMNTA